MFNVMRSRWFYLSDKFLIGNHPDTSCPILLLRNGVDHKEVPSQEVGKILNLNSMVITGEIKEENGYYYYPLKEKKDVTKANSNRLQNGGEAARYPV